MKGSRLHCDTYAGSTRQQPAICPQCKRQTIPGLFRVENLRSVLGLQYKRGITPPPPKEGQNIANPSQKDSTQPSASAPVSDRRTRHPSPPIKTSNRLRFLFSIGHISSMHALVRSVIHGPDYQGPIKIITLRSLHITTHSPPLYLPSAAPWMAQQ